MSTPRRSMIVVGASAGGVEALSNLMGQLPAELPASVLIVVHVPASSLGALGHVLDRAGPLKAAIARHEEPIQEGRVYVARPDHHLLVARDRLLVVQGPRENHSRPAIDPLFRSAAVYYGPQVIGVVLTGYLDDGTAGLLAVKRCGGTTIVQDPQDAIVPDMPKNALAQVEADYVVPLAQLGPLLVRLVQEPAGVSVPIPRDLQTEVALMERGGRDITTSEPLGEPTVFTCPECGGTLRQLEHEPVPRFRCQIGHGYTLKGILSDKAHKIEDTLWAVVRAFKERRSLLTRMLNFARQRNFDQSAADYEHQLADSQHHLQQLRTFLLSGPLSTAKATAPSEEENTEKGNHDPRAVAPSDKS